MRSVAVGVDGVVRGVGAVERIKEPFHFFFVLLVFVNFSRVASTWCPDDDHFCISWNGELFDVLRSPCLLGFGTSSDHVAM